VTKLIPTSVKHKSSIILRSINITEILINLDSQQEAVEGTASESEIKLEILRQLHSVSVFKNMQLVTVKQCTGG